MNTRLEKGYHVQFHPKFSPFKMGLQIPHRIHPEKKEKSPVREPKEGNRKIFHELAKQKECTILEGSNLSDHVHMCVSIPPKHAVSSIIGFLKGKSAIAMARMSGRERNFTGEHFWARGYWVSTVGYELEKVKKYIQEQEEEENKRN